MQRDLELNANAESHTQECPSTEEGKGKFAVGESVWFHIQIAGVQPHSRCSLQHLNPVTSVDFQGSEDMYLYLPVLYWTSATTPLHFSVHLYQKLLSPTTGVEILLNNKFWLTRKFKTDINRKIAF